MDILALYLRAALRLTALIGCALALSTSSFALLPDAELSDYGLENWTAKDGLPQNSIHAILQDMHVFRLDGITDEGGFP